MLNRLCLLFIMIYFVPGLVLGLPYLNPVRARPPQALRVEVRLLLAVQLLRLHADGFRGLQAVGALCGRGGTGGVRSGQ